MVESTMEPLAWLRKQLEVADVDLLREMVATFVDRLMGAEADAICGAPYGERSPSGSWGEPLDEGYAPEMVSVSTPGPLDLPGVVLQ